MPWFEGAFKVILSAQKQINTILVAHSINIKGEELWQTKKKCVSLANKFFTDEEKKEMDNSDDPVRTFFKIWTLKECYMKSSGRGLSLGLKNIDVYNNDYISKSYVVDNDYMVSYIARDR